MNAEPRLSGVVPIVITPFDEEGRFLPHELAREVEWLLTEGVDGLGIAIASELFVLGDDWPEVVRTVVGAAAGAVPVVASVGLDDAHATAQRAIRAADLGASVAMAYPPRDRELETEELIGYYETVAGAGIDLWVQDAPNMTGVEIPVDTYVGLDSRVARINGYKVEAHPTPEKIRAVRDALGPEPVILGGAGGFSFPWELEAGAEGTMPGPSLAPVLVAEWRAFQRAGVAPAREEHERWKPAWEFVQEHVEAFIHLEKISLRERGIFSTAHCRFTPKRITPEEEGVWLSHLRSGSTA